MAGSSKQTFHTLQETPEQRNEGFYCAPVSTYPIKHAGTWG